MFAQLGNILFENLNGFSEFNKSGSAIYAEHALLDGKPRLQRTGTALDIISLTIKFHVSFCNPKQQLAALRTAKNDGEILPLLWGNGEVEGSFVITDLNEVIEDADSQGNVFSYQINVSLTEYVTDNKLLQEKANNRKNAKAVGDKKPTAQRKKNPSTCSQYISSMVNGIENNAAQINAIFIEKGGTATPKNKSEIKLHLSAAGTLIGNILTKCAQPGSCTNGYPDIQVKATDCKTRDEMFMAIVKGDNSLDATASQNTLFQSSVKALKVAARPLINQGITRKP